MEFRQIVATALMSLYRSATSTFLGRFIFAMVLLALFIDVYALVNGLNTPLPVDYAPERYRTFLEVPAWFPFPLYFILIAFVIRQSWDAFNTAWSKLPGTGVIRWRDGGELKGKHADTMMISIIADFEWWRKWVLIPVAFIGGVLCVYLDSERERATMLATFPSVKQYVSTDKDPYDGIQTTFSGQVARACEGPDFQSRWLWDELAKKQISAVDACKLKLCKFEKCTDELVLASKTRRAQYLERVQNVKDLAISRGDAYLPAPTGQWLTEALMHLEDIVLISLGWLIFLQCVAHAVFFWNFERLLAANKEGEELSLKLNCTSSLSEFGLEHWNHALNNLYWYFSGALIIPFLSRISQQNFNDLDTSQLVLQYAMPILAATPMISTILARQSRLPECWMDESPKFIEAYHSQRLWPLDKNWSSKLGILLAFVLLSLSFGINMTMLF